MALRTVEVSTVTPETKAAIALQVMGGDTVPDSVKHLLDVATTGLDAKIVGEVGQKLSSGSSRYDGFYEYARKLLGEMTSDGVRLLSEVAGRLADRIAFSLTSRDFDRLVDRSQVPRAIAQRLHAARLLIAR